MNRIHARWKIALALGVLSGCAFAVPAKAASFDCAKASTKVEHIICDDPELSRLDDEMAAVYKNALRDRTQADEIRFNQTLWLKVRNACTTVVCLRKTYLGQLTLLKSTRDLEYGRGRGAADYVADSTAMDDDMFEHDNTKDVCEMYLQNLQYFATRNLPMSCGQPIAPTLRGRLEKVEWEDLAPDKYPELFREVTGIAAIKDAAVASDQFAKLRDKVVRKEYIFRRAKLTLIGHPMANDRGLSPWAADYARKHQLQERIAPALMLTIIQYGPNINSPHNPDSISRCNEKQIRGGTYFSEKPVFWMGTSDLKHAYEPIQIFNTGITPQYLWRIAGRFYGEGFNGGDIQLTELGAAGGKKDVDSFFFEPVCLYHHIEK